MIKKRLIFIILPFLFALTAQADDLPGLLLKIKPSVVGVGTYQATGQPRNQIVGTGFVVGNGHYVFTNDHVLPKSYDPKYKQTLSIFHGYGKNPAVYPVTIIARNAASDLALLKLNNNVSLPALKLASQKEVREGMDIAFTGFPFGSRFGLYPVTHRGIISAITPMIIPTGSTRHLDEADLRALQNPLNVIQLDAIAYPGNSGSALYSIKTGHVLGILNSVHIKGKKENAISSPTGISFAIPVSEMHKLYDKYVLGL